MKFRQPNSRARAMHQAIDELLAGSAVTLTFQMELETMAGLEALHEVALIRLAKSSRYGPSDSRSITAYCSSG